MNRFGVAVGLVVFAALAAPVPEQEAGRRYNALAVLRDGRVAQTYRKQKLPNYTVFDEERYFDPGAAPCVVEVDDTRFGLIICQGERQGLSTRLQHPLKGALQGSHRPGLVYRLQAALAPVKGAGGGKPGQRGGLGGQTTGAPSGTH